MADNVQSGSDIDQIEDDMVPSDDLPQNNDNQNTQTGQTQTFETEKAPNDVELDKKYKKSKFALEHFVWTFFLALAIYDYTTDMLVAIDWSTFNELCPHFRQLDGHLCSESRFHEEGTKLIGLTTLGFLFTFVSKCYELYIFIIIWRRCSTVKEKEDYQFKMFRCEIYIGWVSLVVEDLISLFIITNTLSQSTEDLNGIDTSLIEQSLIITSLSLILNYINFMRLLLYSNKDRIAEVINKCCQYFCYIFWILMGLGLLFGVINCFVALNDNLYQQDGYNYQFGSGSPVYVEMGERGGCAKGEQGKGYDFIDGNLDEFAELPSTNNSACNIYEYNFTPDCRLFYDQNDDGDDHVLNCSLLIPDSFEQNNMNCSIYDQIVQCKEFQIQFPFCGNYTVPCDFNDGDMVFYVCFDYCYYTL